MLLEAIPRLSEREQHIIALSYWDDQSPQQVAQQLGLTASNVIKIRQRAIKKLRKLLDVKGQGGRHE
jgi:RNA polymerase sigma factor (sigma-70 family)